MGQVGQQSMMTATFVDRILGALGDNGPRVDSAF